jgi:predicted nucleic acid-binding protein
MGSIGVLLRALKMGLVSKSEALGKLDELSRVMWLSPDAYEETVKLVSGWK